MEAHSLVNKINFHEEKKMFAIFKITAIVISIQAKKNCKFVNNRDILASIGKQFNSKRRQKFNNICGKKSFLDDDFFYFD